MNYKIYSLLQYDRSLKPEDMILRNHYCSDRSLGMVLEYFDSKNYNYKYEPYSPKLFYDPGGMRIEGLPSYTIAGMLDVNCQYIQDLYDVLRRDFTYRGNVNKWVRIPCRHSNICLDERELEVLKESLTDEIFNEAHDIYMKRLDQIIKGKRNVSKL